MACRFLSLVVLALWSISFIKSAPSGCPDVKCPEQRDPSLCPMINIKRIGGLSCTLCPILERCKKTSAGAKVDRKCPDLSLCPVPIEDECYGPVPEVNGCSQCAKILSGGACNMVEQTGMLESFHF